MDCHIKECLFFILFTICSLKGSQPPESFEYTINVLEDGVYPEKLIFHTMNNSHLAILDSTINPYWLVKVSEMGLDFKVNQNNLTYFHKDSLFWIVLNNNMLEVDTLRCVIGLEADYHDIVLLEDGGYILQSYFDAVIDMSQYISNGHPQASVNELVLQEFDSNHNLIFEWYAHNHLDISLYTHLNLTNSEFTWMHGNSIEVDYDNNLIISNRRSSEAIKIDRNTGEIIWILGGPDNDFIFLYDTYNGFSKQHDVRRLNNGNILLFDNGTGHNPQLSRVCEYYLNLESMTAELIWEYSHPEEYVGLSLGSVQRLDNGNTLINWGNIPNKGPIITEINAEKEIVLELEFPENDNIYKVRKSDWEFSLNMVVGDINLDNTINIVDLLTILNLVLIGNEVEPIYNIYKSDLNQDGEIGIPDIIMIINFILGE